MAPTSRSAAERRSSPDFFRGIARSGGGGNVTLPHKEEAATLVEVPSDAVRRTGACNTFWLERRPHPRRQHGRGGVSQGARRRTSGSPRRTASPVTGGRWGRASRLGGPSGPRSHGGGGLESHSRPRSSHGASHRGRACEGARGRAGTCGLRSRRERHVCRAGPSRRVTGGPGHARRRVRRHGHRVRRPNGAAPRSLGSGDRGMGR